MTAVLGRENRGKNAGQLLGTVLLDCTSSLVEESIGPWI